VRADGVVTALPVEAVRVHLERDARVLVAEHGRDGHRIKAGTFTTTSVDASGAINRYTITHSVSGLTVTQSPVTREAAGAVVAKPALS
jgi:hypothetical protein